jgi:hypothetical protein
VVSHYNEDVNTLADTIKQITSRLKGSTRVIIYSKGDRDQAGLEELLEHADEVVPLKNIGREGETYLVSLNYSHSKFKANLQASYNSSLRIRRNRPGRPYTILATSSRMGLDPITKGVFGTAQYRFLVIRTLQGKDMYA